MTVSIGFLFAPTVLTGSAAVIYTVPSAPPTTVLMNGRVRFTNTSGSTRSITLYAVGSAGSPSSANCQMNAETLAANAHVDVDVPQMGPGATLQAFADTGSDVTVSALAGIIIS